MLMRILLTLALVSTLLLLAGCNHSKVAQTLSIPPTPSLPEGTPSLTPTTSPPSSANVGSLTETSSAVNVEPKLLTITASFQSRQSTVEAEGPFPQAIDTATSDLRPSPTADWNPIPHRKAGAGTIVETIYRPKSWVDAGWGTENFWVADYDRIVVYGGCEGEGVPPVQGVVLVVVNGDEPNPALYPTPIHDGPLTITDASGHTLLLRSEFHNYLWSFDVDTRTLGSPPDVSTITAPAAPVPVKSAVHFSATFTDAIPTETHTASVDWGDGTVTAGTVTEANGLGTVTGDHAYNSQGMYTLSITVSDNAGASTTTTYRYVTVHALTTG